MMDDSLIHWLLEAETPSLRYLTLRKLLDRQETEPEVQWVRRQMAERGPIPTILAGQSPDGSWSHQSSFYTPKYTSGHWSMLLLAELAADPQDERLKLGAGAVLDDIHRRQPEYLNGSKYGWTCLWANLLYYSTYCGMRDDPRLLPVIERLIDDGLRMEWRCHSNGDQPCAWGAGRSLWPLAALESHKHHEGIRQSIQSAAEFFLEHYDLMEVNYPLGEGVKSSPLWLRLNFPLFYQADTLLVLRALAELKMLDHPKAQAALEWLRSLRGANGRWKGANPYKNRTWPVLGGPEETQRWVTLHASVVLKAAGG